MRTKALVCAAVLGIGIASTMAQSVYSLNVVGYYNVTVPANAMQMIANQFNTTNNTIAALIPAPPVNSQFYKWNGAGYDIFTFDEFDLVWAPSGAATLNPGEGGFFKNVTASPLTLTFVGEVPQGALSNPIPNGYSIRASMVPQAGGVDTLGFPPVANDQIYKYNNTGAGSFDIFTFDEFDLVWAPSVPSVNVGEAIFISKVGAATWTRNFTVQ